MTVAKYLGLGTRQALRDRKRARTGLWSDKKPSERMTLGILLMNSRHNHFRIKLITEKDQVSEKNGQSAKMNVERKENATRGCFVITNFISPFGELSTRS